MDTAVLGGIAIVNNYRRKIASACSFFPSVADGK